MSETLKIRYKVGEIEFEAEGSPEAVEQQRVNFMSGVLPAAVDAMVQTHQVVNTAQYIESSPSLAMLGAGNDTALSQPQVTVTGDLARTSLAAFLNPYGPLTEQDFTLFAAYFDEKKNGQKSFSIEQVKEYYSDARRHLPSNPSDNLLKLAGKGYIMDTEAPDDTKSGKYYMLSSVGISYVESYAPKEKKNGIKKRNAKRPSKKTESAYATITADDLNLTNYPAVKEVKGAKAQILLAMYIVNHEGKGEWFSVDDVIYLMINIFEIPCDTDKVNGVIKRNRSYFQKKQDEHNGRAYSYKLLSGAKDFAESLIKKE